jgi:hypothetical protein
MKKTATLSLMFVASLLAAQSKGKEHFSFGFCLGAETQALGIELLSRQDPDQVYVYPVGRGMGASVGVFAQKKWWRGWSFKPELVIAYSQNQAVFKTEGTRRYHFWDVELPLHLMFSDPRREAAAVRGCILFGGRLSWNLANTDQSLLSIAQERVALDIGLGAEIRLGKCRVRPVFVYSHGMNNIHALGNAPYDWLVGHMVRDRLSLRVGLRKS